MGVTCNVEDVSDYEGFAFHSKLINPLGDEIYVDHEVEDGDLDHENIEVV